MFYYAILLMGQNEMGPVSPIEITYVALTLLVSALLNALLFGDISSLIQSIDKQKLINQEKLD